MPHGDPPLPRTQLLSAMAMMGQDGALLGLVEVEAGYGNS